MKADDLVNLSDEASHILVVDDDTRIRTLLHEYLTRHGYRVSAVGSATEAASKLRGLEFDLIILDVMMPGIDGVTFAKSLRVTERDVPILMLTAQTEIDHRLAGLSAGADDYLGKPFDPRELLLRVGNIVKRRTPTDANAIEQIVFGPFTFAILKRELKKSGDHIKLTEREKDILQRFAQNAGETIARHDLVSDASEIGERTIDVQINRLRRKIEDDPTNPRYLQTVRGIGYRLSIE